MQLALVSLDSAETNWWAGRSARGMRHVRRPSRARSARPTFQLHRYGFGVCYTFSGIT